MHLFFPQTSICHLSGCLLLAIPAYARTSLCNLICNLHTHVDRDHVETDVNADGKVCLAYNRSYSFSQGTSFHTWRYTITYQTLSDLIPGTRYYIKHNRVMAVLHI